MIKMNGRSRLEGPNGLLLLLVSMFICDARKKVEKIYLAGPFLSESTIAMGNFAPEFLSRLLWKIGKAHIAGISLSSLCPLLY